MKLKKHRVKKKIHKTADPNYDVHTYGQGKNPFDLETILYYNEREGRDIVIRLYKDKETGEILKWRAR
jgi:hypothetical protein